jgi:hypothetical protein
MINSAFITADIARSTELFSSSEMEILAADVRQLVGMSGAILSFQRFDAFQILHKEPATSLELVLKIRMAVRNFTGKRADVRICMGLGYAEPETTSFTFLKEQLFVATGRAFDEMEKEKEWFQILLTEPDDAAFQAGFSAIGMFTDHLIRQLTFKQDGILTDLLAGRTQTEIASRQGKSLPTVNRQVKAIRWDRIRELNRLYKQLIENRLHHAV